MTPEPAFLRFFDDEFRRRLDRADVPGLPGASWDRRAAWLLWTAEGRAPSASDLPTDNTNETDIFG